MPMDFFERQEQARTKSWKLALLFVAALPCVVGAVYLVSLAVAFIGYAFFAFWSGVFTEIHGSAGADYFISLWQPTLLLWVALVTLLVIVAGSIFKVRQLAPGGRVVATLLGGTRLNAATKDLNELRLLHVVEEMSVASGTPMPDIYALKREFGLNAFVAGHTSSDMVVTVTQGCVRELTRDELQGVIAHEYSHLLNGDMRLNMRLMGWVHGLFCITLLSYWVMSKTYSERERDMLGQPETRGGLAIFMDLFILVTGFLLAFIGWNSAFFGRMIKGAVSRQREFLADAAAVQFTRYPEGLAGALKKAKSAPEGTVIHSVHAEEASHIYFCNGLEDERGRLTSTHPPLNERIRRVEAMMGQVFVPEPSKPRVSSPAEDGKWKPDHEAVLPSFGGVGGGFAPKVPGTQIPVEPERVLANVGVPTKQHVVYAARLIESLPADIREAAHDPPGARALIAALLLSGDERVRTEQRQRLNETAPEIIQRLDQLVPSAAALSENVKIPLVELSLPALRQMSRTDYEAFSGVVSRLASADQQVDLFEFALQKMLRRHLEPQFRPVAPPAVRYHAISRLKFACSALLSALAHAGQEGDGAAQAAFARGVNVLGTAASEFKFMPLAECTLNAIEVSLGNLAEAAPRVKKDLLRACAETVAADGSVHPREAELLRAIADSLDCPIPPFVPLAKV